MSTSEADTTEFLVDSEDEIEVYSSLGDVAVSGKGETRFVALSCDVGRKVVSTERLVLGMQQRP